MKQSCHQPCCSRLPRCSGLRRAAARKAEQPGGWRCRRLLSLDIGQQGPCIGLTGSTDGCAAPACKPEHASRLFWRWWNLVRWVSICMVNAPIGKKLPSFGMCISADPCPSSACKADHPCRHVWCSPLLLLCWLERFSSGALIRARSIRQANMLGS